MKLPDTSINAQIACDCALRNAAADTSPRTVIRGETHQRDISTQQPDAFIDWLAFSVWPPEGHDIDWLMGMLDEIFNIPPSNWKETDRGWSGYQHRIQLTDLGLVAYGGTSQKGSIHVELNANACRFVKNWNDVYEWGNTYTTNITRVDLAHDDFTGQQINIENGLEWHKNGKFNNNGRPPAAKFIDDLGSGKGKTLYVGQRTNGKLLRIYEKGKQLGDPASAWARAEVELRNKSRSIPWDVVLTPGSFLAGAYPALRFLSSTQSRLDTIHRSKDIQYLSLIKNVRRQHGKSINFISLIHPDDPKAVLSLLRRDGIPKRFNNYKHLLPQFKEAEDE